jgi:SAM-dependent methyltransferase
MPFSYTQFRASARGFATAIAVCMGMIASVAHSQAPAANAPARGAESDTSATIEQFKKDRAALRALPLSAPGKQFLDQVEALPPKVNRTIYSQSSTRRTVSPAAFAALDVTAREGLQKREVQEERYYSTFYGSPLAYVRTLDIAAKFGLKSLSGQRIFDYGYGAIGAPRLIAAAGANFVGVDVDPFLLAVYNDPADQGTMAGVGGSKGSLKLVHGFFPNDGKVRTEVGKDFDLIVSKNTLKKGFVTPEPTEKQKSQRPSATPMKPMIEIGMPAVEYLKHFADVLKPGGVFVIYNIGGLQREDFYAPPADIRSPFTTAEYEAAGFRVLAFDENDDIAVRAMGAALGWEPSMGDLSKNLFALYTVVAKR